MKPLFWFFLPLIILFAACEEKEKEITVQSIAISQPSAEMVIGETLNLKASISPSNATYDGITWTSTKTSVATVSGSGQVSALAEGNTTITAMAGGKTAACAITVVKGYVAVSSISLNKDRLDLLIGESQSLTAVVLPEDATDKTVSWISSNNSIATVSSDGVVTAKSVGSATITVTTNDGGKKATCAVTVQAKTVPVTGVSLNTTSLSMTEGDTQTLTATVTPSNATNKAVTWSSNNSSVATVSSSGVVTAKSVGSAIITVTTNDGGKTATCNVSVSLLRVPEAVDLGLPSGIKWASFNLGATKPEEYGDYYAWGETEPKNDYSWATYKWCKGSVTTMTKYCSNPAYGYNGFTDNKTILDPEDDAAHVNLGSRWRMPTGADWTELIDHCTWTWTTQNGVKGMLVIANNGNRIFLPAAGSWGNTSLFDAGSSGRYWSPSPNTDYAWGVYFNSGGVDRECYRRYAGLSVRPVYGELISVKSVSLNKTALSMTEGDTQTLTATVTPSNATDNSVTWTSSNTSVATVSSSGVVTAKTVGSATITVKTNDGGKTATCTVTVTAPYTVATPEAIDLGLPSGLKWASFNLGASKPEEYGDYYAWGETEPYYSIQDPLVWKEGKGAGYNWASYKWCMRSLYSLTKYCSDSAFGYNGFTDNKTILDPEDDAAHVNLGSRWRMPTDAEWTELIDHCTWTWTNNYKGTGVSGRIVTSKKTGYENKSIFLPAAGYRYDTYLYNAGSRGYYWSSSLSSDNPRGAWNIFFLSGDVGRADGSRWNGRSVRPVTE